MYLQKYLVRNILYTLKVTIKLRYYEKGYVQEFMAAATSFLLRNAPQEQLRKGIRKIMFEVLRKPLPDRKSGVSSLLYHVMKGTSSRFHSRAEGILWLLTDNSTLTIGDRFDQGLVTVVEVVTTTFRRLCEELEPKEINLILNCLYQRIDDCLNNHYLHLICLLSLLISTVQFNSGHKISGV
uniref:Small subunit processome component 20 homolog n=1 Tax=Rhizophora mucronata TaxID=61149 RepID=A0A2P2MER2_RHIMU